MGNIIQLPQTIIAQIAAGEVIERPSYAIKELIENALDAHADFIRIELELSGLQKITVIDNGEGMDPADLELCWQPHTTSKLRSIDHLQKIQSFGFRGEALASIAGISDTTIASRRSSDPIGKKIEIHGGQCIGSTNIGMPQGTAITVKHIFAHVPARKKFLKSARTEYRHILDIITRQALANTRVRFQIFHNDTEVLDLPKNQPLGHRIKQLLGASLYEFLVPVRFEDSYLNLSGFLGKPQVANGSTSHQFTYINGRFVSDALISSAVKDAFTVLIASKAAPAFILFVELPHDLVDVNVHPRKEQVTFYQPNTIYETVKQAITQTLAEHNLTYSSTDLLPKDRDTESFAGQLLKDDVLLDKPTIGSIINPVDNIQIHHCYLVFQTTEGIQIVDQHAAHERILYEEFKQAFVDKKSGQFTLPKPVMLDLPLSDMEAVGEYQPIFADLGFAIEQFGMTTIKVTSIPKLIKDRNVTKLLTELIEDLKSDHGIKDIDTRSDRMLKFLACKAAVKAGDKLSKLQAADIITKLEHTDMAYTCPHGRPTKITIAETQLIKSFKR